MKFDSIIKNEVPDIYSWSLNEFETARKIDFKKNIDVDYNNSYKYPKFVGYLKTIYTGKAWIVTEAFVQKIFQQSVLSRRNGTL